MCGKPKKPKPIQEKPVQYLRNPFLDAIGLPSEAGRNDLRIDLGSGRAPIRPNAKTSTFPDLGIPLPGLLIPTRGTGRGGGSKFGRAQPF